MASISVVICCYNSAAVLQETLEHLKCQVFTDEKWEVIVVDNNSNDGTAEAARQAWALRAPDRVDFRVVSEPSPGLSHARLKGVAEARYEVISFIDDDNHVPPGWIAYQSRTFDRQEIGILGCTAVARTEDPAPEWYASNEHAFATGRLYEGDLVNITDRGTVYGAGMCIRKEIFTHLQRMGWSPLLSGRKGNSQSGGEDAELCLAARLLGYQLFYTNEIEIQHYLAPSRVTWDRLKKMTWGFGASDVFLLVYELLYHENTGRKTLNTVLRKHWWFNYLGKKINYFLKRGTVEDPGQRELFEIRNRAFCETILQEKKRFTEAFSHLGKLF